MATKHIEIAHKFFQEGIQIVDNDPIQASEKLYKAAEEAVKALAIINNLDKILTRVKNRGRWTVTDLENVIDAITKTYGEEIETSWDAAWRLHVFGFHEAMLTPEEVKTAIPHIHKLLQKLPQRSTQTT